MNEVELPLRKPLTDDHLLPLINVVFLLLIFFMLVGALDTHDGSELAPVESLSTTAFEDAAWTLLIDQRGELRLEGAAISLTDLAVRAIEQPPQGVVALRADARIQATDVVDVLDVLRGAGVERVQLMTVGQR